MSDKYYSNGSGAAVIEKNSGKGVNAGLIIFILGLMLTAVGVFMCHNTDLNKYYKTKDYSIAFDADKVKNININNGTGDFDIKKGSGKDIEVIGENVSEDFIAELNGDTIEITSPKTRNFWLSLPMLTYKSTKIEIRLPEKEYNALTMEDGVGDIDLTDAEFKEIKLNGGTGDCKINKISCGDIYIETGTGDLEVKDVKCSSCQFIAGTGDTKIHDIDTDKSELFVKCGTGDLEIKKAVTGGLKINNGTGDTEFSGTVNGNIDIETGAGDLELALTNPETDFGKSGKYKMTIDKGIGDQEISYNN